MKALSNSPLDHTILRLEQRKSFSFGLWIVEANQKKRDLSGATIRLTAREAPMRGARLADSKLVLEREATIIDAPKGYARIDLQASDLNLVAASYPYSITLVGNDGYSSTIVKGEIEVVGNPEMLSTTEQYGPLTPPQDLNVVLRGPNVLQVVPSPALPPELSGVRSAKITEDGDLILYLGDGSSHNAGKVQGGRGETGPQGPRGEQGMRGPQGEPGPRGLSGLDGHTGSPGPKGEDGETQYTHIAYADDKFGNGFSQNPIDRNGVEKEYIGMYVDFKKADSQHPEDYKWTRWKGYPGDQGVPGQPGKDGKTQYFHIAWADSADGSVNFSTTEADERKFMGTYTDFELLDSEDHTDYVWVRIAGRIGPQGIQGIQGLQGPKGEQGIPGLTGGRGPQGIPGLTGDQGPQGIPGVDGGVLRIDSSRGTTFKHSNISTVLSVTVFKGEHTITDIHGLWEAFGPNAFLEWSWRREEDEDFGLLSVMDSRLSNAGFTLTVSPDDVDEKTVFQCVVQA